MTFCKQFCMISFFVLATAIHADEKTIKPEKPFVWPDLPGPETVQEFPGTESPSGLLVLDRRVKVSIGSDIRLEEFVRIKIVSEEGIRNASFVVNPTSDYSVDKVEGRTISKDGMITPLGDKDLTTEKAEFMWDEESRHSQVSVRYPAPSVGSMLDLHYYAHSHQYGAEFIFSTIEAFEWDIAPTEFVLPLLHNSLSTCHAEIEIVPAVAKMGWQWNLMTVGDRRGACKLEAIQSGQYLVKMGPYPGEEREPYAPPALRTQPTVLCYMYKADDKLDSKLPKPTQSTLRIDSRGRLNGLSFSKGDANGAWWSGLITKQMEAYEEFIRKPGVAKGVDVDAVAPPSLPTGERARKLFAFVQAGLTYDPYVIPCSHLADALRIGMRRTAYGTLYFHYLLNRAGIANRIVLVNRRDGIQFSPMIKSMSVYDFEPAVQIEGETQLSMPGDHGLEYGTLPYARQDALVLLLDQKGDLQTSYSTVTSPERDFFKVSAELELDLSGNAQGSVRTEAGGARAYALRKWWSQQKMARASRDRPKSRNEDPNDFLETTERRIREHLGMEGGGVSLYEPTLTRCERVAQSPLEVEARAIVQQAASSGGRQWQVFLFPLQKGRSNPLVREERRNPLWNLEGGIKRFETKLILPAGAKVIAIPKDQTILGPAGLTASARFKIQEENGRVHLRSWIEYSQPTVLGTEYYSGYRAYLDALTRLRMEVCTVEIEGEKTLE